MNSILYNIHWLKKVSWTKPNYWIFISLKKQAFLSCLLKIFVSLRDKETDRGRHRKGRKDEIGWKRMNYVLLHSLNACRDCRWEHHTGAPCGCQAPSTWAISAVSQGKASHEAGFRGNPTAPMGDPGMQTLLKSTHSDLFSHLLIF